MEHSVTDRPPSMVHSVTEQSVHGLQFSQALCRGHVGDLAVATVAILRNIGQISKSSRIRPLLVSTRPRGGSAHCVQLYPAVPLSAPCHGVSCAARGTQNRALALQHNPYRSCNQPADPCRAQVLCVFSRGYAAGVPHYGSTRKIALYPGRSWGLITASSCW
jgi:hypothetical protein